MTKLEKVISGLKNCERNSCNSCPYANDDGDSPYRTCRQNEMLADALGTIIKTESAFRIINAKYLSLLDRLEQNDEES